MRDLRSHESDLAENFTVVNLCLSLTYFSSAHIKHEAFNDIFQAHVVDHLCRACEELESLSSHQRRKQVLARLLLIN